MGQRLKMRQRSEMRRPFETWLRAVVSGMLAVLGGIAAGELAAIPLSRMASPFQAVTAFLVDNSPAPAREWAITTFGTNDKPALMIGVAIALALLSMLAGILQVARPPAGVVLVILVAAFGAFAAATRPTADVSYVIPAIVAGVVAVAILIVLGRKSIATQKVSSGPDEVLENADDTTSSGTSRRAFLVAAAVVAGASAVSLVVARRVADAGGVIAERARLVLPRAKSAAPPIPSGVDVDGATPFLTSNADFYRIDTALQVPQLSTSDWRLRIHGMVDREITLDWNDLMAMSAQERIITLTCVSNEVGGDLASNARWIGYPMRDLLAMAKPHADADMLLSTSVDGWTSGTPLEAITDGRDAMLAVGMNGTPLPLEHGYPARQVIPGLYGFVSACKWVIDWEITRFDQAQSYWAKRGWGVKAPIKTASRIDTPAPLSNIAAGPVVVAGTAWAQHRGVRKVEVRVDDGEWNTATLATEYSTDTWRQWSWTWGATPGNHTLYCRATDADGKTQTDQRVAPIPDGATGWHSRVVRVA